MLRIPRCLNNRLTYGGKVASLTRRPLLYSPHILLLCFWYSFLLETEKTPWPIAARRIRKIHKILSPRWISNPRLPACNLAPWPLCYSVRIPFLRSVRRLLVTANVVPSSQILAILMMEAWSSSETSVLTRGTWRNIPEDSIHHSYCRECLKSYISNSCLAYNSRARTRREHFSKNSSYSCVSWTRRRTIPLL
jgi:hypothetical protein